MTKTDIENTIKQILIETLSLDLAADDMKADMALLGELPEFDSMAIVSVITSIEESFEITFDDDELSADLFETIGSLTDFVAARVS